MYSKSSSEDSTCFELTLNSFFLQIQDCLRYINGYGFLWVCLTRCHVCLIRPIIDYKRVSSRHKHLIKFLQSQRGWKRLGFNSILDLWYWRLWWILLDIASSVELAFLRYLSESLLFAIIWRFGFQTQPWLKNIVFYAFRIWTARM